MNTENTDYIRELYAGKIINNMNRITRIWQELDYYHDNGRLKPDTGLTLQQQISDLSIAEILQLYDNLPPLISRWKNKLKSIPDGPKKETLKMNLALKEAELAAIKKLKDDSL